MFISPMLLESAKDPFDSDDYITEIKFDGIRLLASKDGGRMRLYTRHNNEVTAKFPELHTIQIPDGTILDGAPQWLFGTTMSGDNSGGTG
ncbi:ATP-dependent DNA ligase, partial [Spongiibacter marinus]|uniref:ATP-dependent DNA ligase n=1 Tax=Spongiibacter marinus TaxID=354246 RepID=UPI004046F9BB